MKTHTVAQNEEKYFIDRAPNLTFDASNFYYSFSTPHIPDRTFRYNMGLRNPGLDITRYTTEAVTLPARDGTAIPVTLFYNKSEFTEKSPVILSLSDALSDAKETQKFNHELVSLLDRGFIMAYPHIRGSRDCGEQWFTLGARERKPTQINDLVDVAKEVLNCEISKTVCLLASGPSACVTAAAALNSEPALFHTMCLSDGVYSLLEHLEKDETDNTKKEFGPISDKEFFDTMRVYDPYWNMAGIKDLNTDVLILADGKEESVYQSRKFVAKLRDNVQNDNAFIVYHETVDEPEHENSCFKYSYLINNIFNRVQKDILSVNDRRER
eukprot:CAMPEP_0115041086 /NCGR_PEP_ID=MMETSP0216-20121206/45299_1 /TAXON_ID=223996 /ORGANISM="Protocruzia adherens, Strain Boccale" /LENGTH=325 /DNA_ID=CAMNT_0002422619 /DNA_START=32 /DNA_END=1005 /DNA_ORIENTATION=-